MQVVQDFKPGDKVRMAVGGPLMSVEGPTPEGKVVCAWFEGERPRSRECWPSQLVHHELAANAAEDDDELGLLRRKTFNHDLVANVSNSIEANEPLALVMIDLDKFKAVNDTYGHSTGDDVLRSVATSMKKAAEGKGHCYRYGGEELAILLANYTPEEAAALAERIRKSVETSSIGDQNVNVTASFGVAGIPEHAETAQELVAASDLALYQAKNLGRNLVRLSGEALPDRSGLPVIRIKKPTGNSLTERQLEDVRKRYFQYGSVSCPRDESVLRVQELQSDEQVMPGLIVTCPLCGLNERIEAP